MEWSCCGFTLRRVRVSSSLHWGVAAPSRGFLGLLTTPSKKSFRWRGTLASGSGEISQVRRLRNSGSSSRFTDFCSLGISTGDRFRGRCSVASSRLHLVCRRSFSSETAEEQKAQVPQSEVGAKAFDLDLASTARDASDSVESEEAKRAADVVALLQAEDLEAPARQPQPFCDFLWISAKAGRGGSPRKGAFRSRALGKGPGFGGHGGCVLLRGSQNTRCLISVPQRIKAASGGDAVGTSRGIHAQDTIVKVPLGTIVRKRIATGEKSPQGRAVKKSVFWEQILENGQTLLVARGGRGGIAPPSIKQLKKKREPEPGSHVDLELELRLPNDVALVGESASGKTSLASALTDYQSRIGTGGFTTRRPHLATLKFDDGTQATLLDLPAVFPGAHKDKRLGLRILRHLYRSRLILYVLDPTQTTHSQDPRVLLAHHAERRQLGGGTNQTPPTLLGSEETVSPQLRRNSNKLKSRALVDGDARSAEEKPLGRRPTPQISKDDKEQSTSKSAAKVDVSIQQPVGMQEDLLLDTFGQTSPDMFCQLLRLRREVRKHDPHFERRRELAVVCKSDALHVNALLAVDSLYFRLRAYLPHISVVAASPRFGLGSAAVAEAIWRLLQQETAPDVSNRQHVVLETDPLIPSGEAFLDEGQKIG